MGSSSSSMKRTGSTPLITGRLRIEESPRLSVRGSPGLSSPRVGRGFDGSRELMRPSSLTNVAGLATERSPLIMGRDLKSASQPMESDIPGLGSPISAPPLLVWITPALLCAFSYALYNIFIKRGSDSIHPVLGGVILQIVAAFLGACLLSFIIAKDGIDELQYDQTGINWSICAGLAVGAAEMLSFFVMGMGVQAMQAVPIIIGGSVMFGTVLGYLWLHEVLSWQGWFGVILLVVGISMVATDPGSGFSNGG